jgi:hypothetical protein
MMEHPNYKPAMAEIMCVLGLPNTPSMMLRIMEGLRFANIENYKPTIPTNPIHEIFMAKAKGYIMKNLSIDKNLPDEATWWDDWAYFEVKNWERRLLPINEQQ